MGKKKRWQHKYRRLDPVGRLAAAGAAAATPGGSKRRAKSPLTVALLDSADGSPLGSS